jgi:MFS family permease
MYSRMCGGALSQKLSYICFRMIGILRNRTYRHLFAAQVIALIGTGLMTVALGLLAFELAGGQAGAVLGTALAIKMIAYVGVAPVAGAFAARLPRRAFLVAMDLVRASVALALPFIDQVWQIYVLIFVLQSASAAFTPTFQATIPDVLPDERDYTRALSLSRLAYDMESLISPILAAALLTLIGFHWLFAGTVFGFLLSAGLVVSVQLPKAVPATPGGIYDKITRGSRIYLATPRLRGLLALNLSVAAAGAMVIVNTVVLVREMLAKSDADVALALACFGGGSMVAALALPKLLDRVDDRRVMLPAAGALALLLFVFALLTRLDGGLLWAGLLVIWMLLGLCYSAVMTPTGRLLRRSAHAADRPALYAAQFALSHACWLLTYPLAGWLGGTAGMTVTAVALAFVTALGAVLAALLWPAQDPDILAHEHRDLSPGHPHLQESGTRHAHAFVIDDLHPHWPQPAR